MAEILRTENLTKNFGGLCAVKDVSFSIHEGNIMGLIGPNGAGKTTLINLISGAFPPSSGRVFFTEKDISRCKAHTANNMGIARTFQIVRIFSQLTARENILAALVDRRMNGPWKLMGKAIFSISSALIDNKEAVREADRLLDFVGISQYGDEQAGNLPYALSKRLEIARAMATGPKLLLLDEPSSGLNPAELVDQIQLIKQINQQGITILIIEHVMKVIMDISHRLIVLHYGEKIAEGDPMKVYTDPQVVEAYLGDDTDAAH